MRYVINPSLFWVKEEKESQKEEKLAEQATKPPTPPSPPPPKLSGSAPEESITFTTEESITFKYYPGFCFGNFSGTAGDSFSYHHGWPFTTPDEDNDFHPDVNCALKYHGGWWFKKCHRAFLNGPYIHGPNSYHGEGVIWAGFKDYRYSLESSQMKIRPRDF